MIRMDNRHESGILSFMKRGVLPELLAVIMVLVAAAVASAAEDEWGIRVKNAAVAQGDRVLLGEIAVPYGSLHEENWKQLAQIPLWNAPAKNKTQMVNRDQLRWAMVKYLGETSGSIIVPSGITIQRGGAVLGSEEIYRRVVDYLTPRLNSLPGDAKARDFSTPQAVFLPEKWSRISISSKAVQAGRLPVRLEIKDMGGKIMRRVSVSLFIDQWLTVPCAARPLNTNQILTPEDVTFQRKNAAYLKEAPLDPKMIGLERRLKRPVGEGMPIFAENLEAVPMIQKGDKIDLVFKGKSIRLVATAEALADGGPGERIRVRNLGSERIVYATVEGAKTVVVRR